MAFSGDLIHEGGKLYQLYAMEYNYGDMLGLLFTHQSVTKLSGEKPDLCLPSHGPIIENPDLCITGLKDRLRQLIRLTSPEQEECLNEHLYPISKHLLWGGVTTASNFYVLKSDSGRAILIDYGMGFAEHLRIRTDRYPYEGVRFVEHHLEEMFDRHGISGIDAIIVTHVHDDHICGIPFLQKHYGVECWTIDEVAGVLEDPARWSSTPCCFDKPIKVQKRCADGGVLSWQEYSITMHYAPGQTEFHAVISLDIDGIKTAFTGDNMFMNQSATWGSHHEDKPIQTQVFRNSFQLSMHDTCKDVIREINPGRICPGHQEPYDFFPARTAAYSDFIEQKAEFFRTLSPEPAEQAVDLFWARLLPYQSTVKPGEEIEFILQLRNNFPGIKKFDAKLIVPTGWQTTDTTPGISLEPDSR